MRTNRKLINAAMAAIVAWAGGSVGCEKAKPQPVTSTLRPAEPSPQVSVAPPTTGPTTQPASQPAASELLINGVYKQFPAARLRLIVADEHVTAVLYSADPASAINDDYTGNSFYLRMPLNDVKDLASVSGAEWRYKSITSGHTDTSDGIFLDGLKHQLQPMDVVVRFDGTGSNVRVRLAGEFLNFDNATPLLPGALTPVGGDLTAAVDSATP